MNMAIKRAIKEEKAIEINLDQYLLEDNRIIVYDRYSSGNAKWVDENGRSYRNFHEAFYRI